MTSAQPSGALPATPFVMPFARRILDPPATVRGGPEANLDDFDETELPDPDISEADLWPEYRSLRTLRQRPDEFRCRGCHLVLHRNRMTPQPDTSPVCIDCETPVMPANAPTQIVPH